MKFLIVSSVGPLNEFRIPELDSIAALYAFTIGYPAEVDIHRPYLVVDLASEREARLIGERAILVKHIWHYIADAAGYDQLHDRVKASRQLWEEQAENATLSWKFVVGTYGQAIAMPDQVAVINTFNYMRWKGPISLKKAACEIGVFEEYPYQLNVPGQATLSRELRGRDTSAMRRVWMGRKVCEAQRHLMDVFDLKKRSYIGTTSMEAEVSLIMANQALAGPGKMVYDPFAGTGSMLLTGSAFGALSFGSDIDGRQLRGKKTNILDNAEQYGIRHRLVDTCSFDMTQHPFRTGEIFDAIITDPPYGVRAGAKRLGRKDGQKEVQPTIVPGREAEGFHHQLAEYVPPSVPWEMTEVINSLISYSLFLLKPGGRLVFFLPTDNADYKDVDVPKVPGLRLVANSSQSFGKWARRLITMEKVGREADEVIEGLDRGILRSGMRDPMQPEELERVAGKGKPGHADFAIRYREGFRREETEAAA